MIINIDLKEATSPISVNYGPHTSSGAPTLSITIHPTISVSTMNTPAPALVPDTASVNGSYVSGMEMSLSPSSTPAERGWGHRSELIPNTAPTYPEMFLEDPMDTTPDSSVIPHANPQDEELANFSVDQASWAVVRRLSFGSETEESSVALSAIDTNSASFAELPNMDGYLQNDSAEEELAGSDIE